MSELCDLSAVELRALIGRKAISPSELMTASIKRIEEIDPILNAIPIRDFDRAIESAKAADKRLLAGNPLPSLFGLPLGVKPAGSDVFVHRRASFERGSGPLG